MGVSINGDTPIAGWFIRENPHLEMDDLGFPPFQETSMWWHILCSGGSIHCPCSRPSSSSHIETPDTWSSELELDGLRHSGIQNAEDLQLLWIQTSSTTNDVSWLRNLCRSNGTLHRLSARSRQHGSMWCNVSSRLSSSSWGYPNMVDFGKSDKHGWWPPTFRKPHF